MTENDRKWFAEWLSDSWPILVVLLLAGSCFVERCHVTISISSAPSPTKDGER